MPFKFRFLTLIAPVLLSVFALSAPAAPGRSSINPTAKHSLKEVGALLDTATGAIEQKDAEKARSLANAALTKLQPLISDPEYPDVNAWCLVGRIALILEDDDMAAVALEAVLRLDPGYADEPAQKIVVDTLNAGPAREKLNRIREGRLALLKLASAARAGNVEAMTNLGFRYATGNRGLVKNEALAFHWFQKGAAGGNATAMYNLGVIYEAGKAGIKKDEVAAVEWYRKAAEAGDSSAMECLALSYENGKATLPEEEAKAIIWHKKAAEAGNGGAMASLGTIYASGMGGIKKDDALATTWYRRGADAGSGRAMAGLGTMYASGRGGLRKDETSAVSWFRKGAATGDGTSMAGLALMYAEGKGGLQEDINEARRWMKKAAAGGFGIANEWLAKHPAPDPQTHQTVATATAIVDNAEKALKQHDNVKSLSLLNHAREMLQPLMREPEFSDIEAWYLAGRIALLTGDDNLATAALGAILRLDPSYADNAEHNNTATALKKRPVLEAVERNAQDRPEVLRLVARAKAGDPSAMTRVGIMYSRGQAVLVKDEVMGAAWLGDAAQKGFGLAMGSLGYMYETGKGVDKDEVIALEWYRKGVAAGDGFSMYNLGFVYEFGGCGLQKDEEKAATLYRKGAEAGDRMAMVRLGKMYTMGRGGLKKDDAIAVTWYLKASAAGESAAMYELGIMHAEGRGGLI
jgi:TPR repeat protein